MLCCDGLRVIYGGHTSTGETQWVKPTAEAPTERAAHDSAVIIAAQCDAEETQSMSSLAAVLHSTALGASEDGGQDLMDVETFGVAPEALVKGVSDGHGDDQVGAPGVSDELDPEDGDKTKVGVGEGGECGSDGAAAATIFGVLPGPSCRTEL